MSLPCRFQDQGAPGRPRKRPRQDQTDRYSPNREKHASASHFSSSIPQTAPLNSQDAANIFIGGSQFEALSCELAGNCGFDALDWEILGNGNLGSFPVELCQASRQNHTFPMASDAYVSPTSLSGACKCDEEVSDTVRNLSRAEMSHDVVQMLRTGVSLVERLLTCPICYDVSKPPRVTVQNVLLIGQLMFEITSGYQKYIRWLNEHCTDLDAGNKGEAIYLSSGLGIASEFNIQISGEKLRSLVVEGLQDDVERLLALGKQFAQRQRNRHMVGHEACPGPEGRCRKKEYGIDHDPLDLCPQNPAARKLVPCFRIVDEVRGMIKEVADAVA